MSSKDKEKTLQDRLKQFFRLNKGGTGNIKGRLDISLTREIELEIGPESPIHHRIKVIRELSDAVLQNHLEEHAIEKLWSLTEDLLKDDVGRENRHAAFQFLCSLAQGQADKLGLMRVQFFRVITSHSLPEDIGPRLELLRALTDNGKDILYIEEQVAPFLLEWMPAVVNANKTQDLLSLLVNLVKYNAAYVEDAVIYTLIKNTCYLCSLNQQEEVVLAGLALLDVVVCYAQMPPDSLDTVIRMLCITVSNKSFCTSCWKIMRKLLCTHLGHSALLHMCKLLQSENTAGLGATILRGAVFHISMGMWGRQKVTSLHTTTAAVLPSFVRALRRSKNEVVAYEIVLCIRRLVTQSPEVITDPAWDCVLDILDEAISQAHSVLAAELHGAISDIETQHERGGYRGDVARFFSLIESVSTARPESSILRLLNHLRAEITPTRTEWLIQLRSLLEHYFRQETRTNIRVKALDVLSTVIHAYRALYEEELIDCVLSLQLQDIARDTDSAVRNAAVQLLIGMALESESKNCIDLLDLVEKFLNQPFETYEADGTVVSGEAEAIDVKSATLGLIKIFHVKTYQLPSSLSIRAYRALVSHLEGHYHQPLVFEKCNITRYLIFRCFLQIRADSLYHLGMPETLVLQDEETSSSLLRFSPYLAVDHRHGERPSAPVASVPQPAPGSVTPPQVQQQAVTTLASTAVTRTCSQTGASTPQPQTGSASPPQQPQPVVPPPLPAPVVTHLSLQHACKAVIVCLKQEKDWRVLSLVLRELPRVLQNKALVLSRHGNDVEYLAAALCAMVSERTLNLPETLRNAPPKFSRSDFQTLVLASLGPLASYPLEPALQQRLVKCLQVGLASRCAGACVSALTLCTLEMRDTMYKLLPEVLLNLSKISATVLVAIPILEFLSTLTRLPKVFASFVGDQYMSVFAIALPYTNPFKYNHYTVSLAHHVIAVWFLKCRLPFRRDFVKFIITGLKANVLGPFEESKKPELVNEDSSNRKRSSSLTEQGSRRREQLAAARLEVKQQPSGVDEELLTFHTELTETCIDLMARHTFSSCAALPRRLGSAEWLLSGGLSMTWLLGHKLVTVATSGCSQKAIRGGLCDKCLTTCRLTHDKVPTTTAPVSPIQQQSAEPELELTPSRRRHKSAIQHSVTGEVAPTTPRTKDDLHMSSARVPEPTENLFGQQSERGIECSCWCQGWAEIYVRRPTGNMSWVMRLQNPPYLHASSPLAPDFPMSDISTLLLPSLVAEETHSCVPEPVVSSPDVRAPESLTFAQVESPAHPTTGSMAVDANSPKAHRPTSEAVPVPGSSSSLDQGDSDGSENEDDDSEGRRRNPVRRSNSSPEMSGRCLKSPLAPLPSAGAADQEAPTSPGHEEKKLAPKQPPTRVSCEAIPEEMGGTTPPTATPTLQSSVSYPGPTKPALTPSRSAPPTQQPPHAPVAEKRPNVAATPQQPETRPDPSALPPLAFRDRGHTISVMSPVRKPDWGALRRQQAANASGGGPTSPRGAKEPPRSGVHPSFVFLQLYHDGQLGSVSAGERPVLVPSNDMVNLALRTLDYIPPYETHKLGVLYVGPDQAGNEAAILQNSAGSVRYTEFLQGLGSLVRLCDVNPATTFLGGLDISGNDGKFAYIWQDAMTQVIFHTATLMPTKETDPSCNNKKRHIGNNYVTIVFNESGQDYNMQCIKGQFNFACVVVTPLGHGTNQVVVKTKDVLAKHLGACSEEPRVISDQSLPTLVRQLALHANLASMIVKQTQARYASNWLERLRHIKRLRARVCAGDAASTGESGANGGRGATIGLQRRVQMDDFTEYTHYK